ncbi:alpha-amylase family glycosyl hydrolase [Dysgonomonas sp. BGC7]|uniref:alpha-amylase family glycosyl hydrolase n=1 Tax=Dysgonomonas sp. BGC7 TaxID=1658008 RepID=UPI00068018EB|nr:alpha-amylase family glycosyl hydrolase [Dysgonomonas sp. BGC7]MBD8389896.1 alpha-amylase [Dysgonomonas sp. BGC7]
MKTKLLFIAIAVIFAGYSCDSKKQIEAPKEKCTVSHQDWTRNAVIYEVNVRQYTKEGTFAAFEQHLPRLKELGVDVLWFMPIHPISEKNRKGTLGSYYAVKDYKEVNPEFGTKEDFKRVVDKAHEMGFKVILDWVANHTGCDNVWTVEHPDWYVRDEAGNFKSPYDWTDTYELNYDNKDMRAGMLDALKYWITDFGIDGYRCDMAHEVPTDFWNDVRPALDSIKPVFMLAESENYDLLEHAFDANYSWELMHMMADVSKGNKNVEDLTTYIQKLDTIKCPDGYKMNFLTNHDENSWNGTEFERYGKGIEAFAVLTYTLNGMPMIYTGQEVGLKKRLSFFEKDMVPSWTENGTTKFYKKLNELKHTHPALRAGSMGGDVRIYTSNAGKELLIFSREKAGKELMVMLNLSDRNITYTSNDALGRNNYYDVFTGKLIGNLPKTLKAWEYRVLTRE